MSFDVYGIGGFNPQAPNNNLIERHDLATGVTRWDSDGNVIEQRTLTADEIAALTPPPVVATPDEKITAAVEALAALDGIEAPVLPTDVLDILTDVRTALEG